MRGKPASTATSEAALWKSAVDMNAPWPPTGVAVRSCLTTFAFIFDPRL